MLRGYIISYKTKSESNYQNLTVSPTSSEALLGNLQKFKVYYIKVAGFTSKGRGPFSHDFDVRTHEDGKET